jgi:hypothetical protein
MKLLLFGAFLFAIAGAAHAQQPQTVYTPEMYGATPSPPFTAAGSVANNQGQIQAALNALAAIGGGTLHFGTGVYGVGNGVTVGNNIIIQGSGIHGTTLLLQPTVPTSAVYFGNGTGIVSNVGIRDLSINTANTTLVKNAITIIDASQTFVDNIMISAYPTGFWTATGATAVGINTQGRELGVVNNVQIYADTPLQISTNPHVAGGTEDLDSWSFRDLILIAPLSAATTNVITVDGGVAIFNSRFEGHQNWIGGVDGFHFSNSSTAASFGLSLSGIKDEQAGASGGFSVNIGPSSGVFGVTISNSLIGVRNGVKLRNVHQALLSGVTYDANTSPTRVGLDADFSNSLIDFRACSWVSGTLATLGAFTPTGTVVPTGFSAALPASGTLSH